MGREAWGQRKRRAVVNAESVAFHWLRACQERSLSASWWALRSSRGLRAPSSVLPTPFKINRGGLP